METNATCLSRVTGCSTTPQLVTLDRTRPSTCAVLTTASPVSSASIAATASIVVIGPLSPNLDDNSTRPEASPSRVETRFNEPVDLVNGVAAKRRGDRSPSGSALRSLFARRTGSDAESELISNELLANKVGTSRFIDSEPIQVRLESVQQLDRSTLSSYMRSMNWRILPFYVMSCPTSCPTSACDTIHS